MNFPLTHPIWMWLYFGILGTAGMVFFALTMWSWTRYHARVGGRLRSAARWTAIGYMFLFFAQWFACGVGGPPGNLLSSNPIDYNAFAAVGAASLSMFFSVPGWVCLYAGQQRLRSDSF